MSIPVTTTLEGPIAALREKTIAAIEDIAQSLSEQGDDAADDVQRLRDVSQDLRDMFFIVAIIGEFNSGKSSFVNALLGDKLLPMGITPTTEHIELIRYAEQVERVPAIRHGSLREWHHPNTGAPGVAIVDTPGTGSVFQKHEEIAKQFLHRSDLVIFLISAKRAFAETERMYLELAQRYGKKVILVVNQADLLKPSEQVEVRHFIENQVKQTLNLEPLLFMVSAKDALEKAGVQSLDDPGNIGAVRAHLRGVYNEAPPAKQKLQAQIDTVLRILDQYQEQMRSRNELVNVDLVKVRDAQKELESQSSSYEARMKEAGVEIDRALEGIRMRGMNFIDTYLNLRKLRRSMDRGALQAEFDEVVIGRSLRDINAAANDYINAVVDQSRLYWRSVIERLNKLRDLMDQEAGSIDSGIYADQRASLQDAIRIAEAELQSYSSGEVVRELKMTFDSNMGSFQLSALASISGLVTALVAALLPGPLVGAAAAPVALPVFLIGGAVALIAGVPAVAYIRKLTRETKEKFNQRVDHLITNYHTALQDLTRKERSRLMQYGNQILAPVFGRLEVLAKRYADQQRLLDRFKRELDDLRERVDLV